MFFICIQNYAANKHIPGKQLKFVILEVIEDNLPSISDLIAQKHDCCYIFITFSLNNLEDVFYYTSLSLVCGSLTEFSDLKVNIKLSLCSVCFKAFI